MKRFVISLLTFTAVTLISLTPRLSVAEKTGQPSDKLISVREAAIFYANVANRVQKEYVDSVDQSNLLEGALNGLLLSLDPHSSYLSPQRFKEIRASIKGEFGGIGIEVTMENGFLRVISPIDGTPADKAGIKPGDLIIMINDEIISGQPLMDSVRHIRGAPGSEIKLTIRRNYTTALDFNFTRAIVKVCPVYWRIEGNVGYLRVTTFINKNTKSELQKAIHEIQDKLGSKIEGYVLDVRNNAGGLFDQAIEVTDVFLKKGEVVSIRGRDSKKDQVYRVKDGLDTTKGAPLVVLINRGSASSSEIVAGALQDHCRAIVVGTKSFGKGSVQVVMPMINGGAIKLTTSLYHTPSGRAIQKTGIEPDITIEQAVDIKEFKEKKWLREENLRRALGSSITKKEKEISKVKASSIKIIIDKKLKDYQLIRAMDVLRGVGLSRRYRKNQLEE